MSKSSKCLNAWAYNTEMRRPAPRSRRRVRCLVGRTKHQLDSASQLLSVLRSSQHRRRCCRVPGKECGMPEPLISKVSDTARWMAAYRATESARHDALFTDPFAERFAGARGHAITAAAPRLTRNGWWWVTRTKLIDDLVTASLQNGCDRVLNLAAGFDTRPYRLDLPAATEWIEADLPELINEKQRLLTGETARCRLSRVAVDLADTPSRSAFLADATSGARDALVITEGLLLYLNAAQVCALADDLHRAEKSGDHRRDRPGTRTKDDAANAQPRKSAHDVRTDRRGRVLRTTRMDRRRHPIHRQARPTMEATTDRVAPGGLPPRTQPARTVPRPLVWSRAFSALATGSAELPELPLSLNCPSSPVACVRPIHV